MQTAAGLSINQAMSIPRFERSQTGLHFVFRADVQPVPQASFTSKQIGEVKMPCSNSITLPSRTLASQRHSLLSATDAPFPSKRGPWNRAQGIRILCLAALIVLGLAATASAQPNCNAAGPLWSATAPPVNQRHIFCGEIVNSQPKGYHSIQIFPPTLSSVWRTSCQSGTARNLGDFNSGSQALNLLPDAVP